MKAILLVIALYSAQGAAQVDCEAALVEHLENDLSLSYEAFDQTMGEGWRQLSNKGCHLESARLIERYSVENDVEGHSALNWHRFQMLAYAAEHEAALELVDRILLSEEQQAEHALRWNDYVLGNVAFLEQDMEALRYHREQVAAGVDDHPGNELNLNVLDRLIEGFDQSYHRAYEGQ